MPSPISIDAIIFDFDGVLVESVSIKGDAFGKLYEHEGPEIEKKVMEYHHAHGGVSRFNKIRYYETELLGRAVSEDDVQKIADRFSDIVEQSVITCPWVIGAKEFLDAHYQSLPFYVASGTPTDELQRIIAARGMSHYFKAIYGSPATKSESIMSAINDHGLNPETTLMIGDAPSDYKGALEAGTPFIGRVAPGETSPFPPGTREIEDLKNLSKLVRYE